MSNYKGDIAAGSTIRFSFNTRDTSGNPITLAGSPVVSIYKGGNSTPCGTAPVLTVNYNSQTGRHMVTVDMSLDATFYATGNDFFAVITTGTVSGISVVGVEVAQWSIGNRTIVTAASVRAEMDSNSTKLANLDAAVSSRLASSAYTAPPAAGPTAVAIRQEMDSNSTKLANLDAAVSSRLASSAYTAPPAAGPTAVAIRQEMDASSTKLAHLTGDVALHSDALTIEAAIAGLGGGTGGGTCTGFSSGALSQLAGISIAVQLPANISASQGTIELTAGDDYLASINRSFNITFTGTLPDMTGGTAYIAFTSAKRVVRVIQMTIVSSTTSTLVIQVQLTAAQTGSFEVGAGTWEPQFTTAAGLKWSIPSTSANPWVLLVDARPS